MSTSIDRFSDPPRVHLVAGGFPRGAAAGHDIDYARFRILQLLQEEGRSTASVSSDFADIDHWLPKCNLLVTYTAGPYPEASQCKSIVGWLESGGALAGTARNERWTRRPLTRWSTGQDDVEGTAS